MLTQPSQNLNLNFLTGDAQVTTLGTNIGLVNQTATAGIAALNGELGTVRILSSVHASPGLPKLNFVSDKGPTSERTPLRE